MQAAHGVGKFASTPDWQWRHDMPKVSRNTASRSVQLEGSDVRLGHLDGGYSVCFEKHTADAEVGALFRGLPGDCCPLPRWGYVIKGKLTFVFSGHRETFEAGDAYYVPLGHTPVHYAGTEIVEFSPTDILEKTIKVVMSNLQRVDAP
jgi:hypothetical protein